MRKDWSPVGRSVVLSLAVVFGASASALCTSFSVTNLVTDDPLVNPAQITDPALVNGWGISHNPTSPFWVSANGTGLSTLYAVNPTTGAVTKVPLEVAIPSAPGGGGGNPTGQAFNGGSGFNADRFVFVSEDGTISGWQGALGTHAEVLVTGSPDNVYKGVALGDVGGNTYLYAANFRTNKIDVQKGESAAPSLPGTFTDPNLPSGYAPFGIANLNGTLYVTYALQDAAGKDDVGGPGNGFVNAFDLQGNFLGRVGSRGSLNSPWGLAIAPSLFGSFAGDLLVGNFGDGTVSVFDQVNDVFLGQLLDGTGHPLVIDGLWGMSVGTGMGLGGSAQSIYFAAGPLDEKHGLFGAITPVPEPISASLLGLGVAGLAVSRRRRAA